MECIQQVLHYQVVITSNVLLGVQVNRSIGKWNVQQVLLTGGFEGLCHQFVTQLIQELENSYVQVMLRSLWGWVLSATWP
jgi:hypothetical protein